MSQTKYVEGTAGWVAMPNSEEYRLKWPLSVDGIPTNATLDVSAHPMVYHYPYTITLNFPPCVWRLEHVPPWDGHTNPFEPMSEFDDEVFGPHFHSWSDNSNYAGQSSLPKELERARVLPDTIKTYEQAFRWFCDQTNIILPSNEFVDLPTRERLL